MIFSHNFHRFPKIIDDFHIPVTAGIQSLFDLERSFRSDQNHQIADGSSCFRQSAIDYLFLLPPSTIPG